MSMAPSAAGRKGTVTYYMMPPDTTETWTLPEWKAQNGPLYSPEDAAISLTNYKVPVGNAPGDDSGQDYVCDYTRVIDPVTGQLLATGLKVPNGEWCNLLEKFRVERRTWHPPSCCNDPTQQCSDTEQALCNQPLEDYLAIMPREYMYHVQVSVPTGKIYRIAGSKCPRFPTITGVDDKKREYALTIENDQMESNEIKVEVYCESDTNGPTASYEYDITPGGRVYVPVVDCGGQVVKVYRRDFATDSWSKKWALCWEITQEMTAPAIAAAGTIKPAIEHRIRIESDHLMEGIVSSALMFVRFSMKMASLQLSNYRSFEEWRQALIEARDEMLAAERIAGRAELHL